MNAERRPRLELLLGIALVCSGIASVVAQQFWFVDPTTPDDWESAAAHVTAAIAPSETFRITPSWADAPLTHFVSHGSQADRLHRPIAEDFMGTTAVWLVSELDRRDEAVARLPFDPGTVQWQEFDSVAAARVPVPNLGFGWSLLADLENTRVSRVKGKKIEPCSRWSANERRWDCGKRNRWLYVGRALREVGDEARECVWAQPHDRGRTLRIEADVPAARAVRVRGSFDLRAARLADRDDVLFRVYLNDELAHDERVPHDDDSWAAHDFDLGGKPATLRLEVEPRGSIKDRYFCVNAWALE